VDSAKTALQNGACTYWCISKQMHKKTPFLHNGYMKSLELMKITSLFSVLKKQSFGNNILTRTMHGILPKVIELTI
jgi:hypothetical protein